jgi:hypothetical protein
LVRADVLVLLREKRYEEALARLYQARSEAPDSVELQKGIDQVKEFLIGAYAKRLGGLDQIPQPIAPQAGRSPDVVLLSRYIDGATSYGDIAEMSPLGRLRTLQVLIEMYGGRSSPAPAVPASRPAPAMPRSESRLLEQHQPVPADDPLPETARSGSSAPPPPPPPPPAETPEDRLYRETFARGTAAFIQGRFADAVEAFEACAKLRPGDGPSEVMLRRARRDLESRW